MQFMQRMRQSLPLTDFEKRFIKLYHKYNTMSYTAKRLGVDVNKVRYYINEVLKDDRPIFKKRGFIETRSEIEILKDEIKALERCAKYFPSFAESAFFRLNKLNKMLNGMINGHYYEQISGNDN